MRQGRFVLLAVLVALTVASVATAALPSPESHFGFQPGADRQLVDYEELIAYLRLLDASPRLELREVGRSPLNRPMYVLFASAPGNLARLDALAEVNRLLARGEPADEMGREALVAEGRVFVMATLSMHSGEVAPAQALPLFAFELATSDDPSLAADLEEMVWMIVPCHNPDGMDMIVEHYRATRGTPYEGSSMPGLYHRYVGHDNNRDFISLTQEDTRVINRLYSTQWYPQVLVEKHQMGSTGPRYFLPPNHDPIAENIDADLWRWSGLFGAALATDMGADGHQGIAQHWLFDNYWPGSTETSLWKNVISFLTEAASCKIATPVRVEPNELSVRGKGLSEYAKGANLVEPWPGGWWRLKDIVAYELSSLRSIQRTAAAQRETILRLRHDLARREIARGRTQAPFYYVLPADQCDRSGLDDLAVLLAEHGVEVFTLGDRVELDGRVLAAGDLVVPLAQPYRAFVKEVMEAQRYPVRRYTPNGEIIRPYDITSWSLPLHYGLSSLEVDRRSQALEAALVPWTAPAPGAFELPAAAWGVALPARDNASFEMVFAALAKGLKVERLSGPQEVEGGTLDAGDFVLEGTRAARAALGALVASVGARPLVLSASPTAPRLQMRMPRIGLIETYFHHMDAGWTRWLLDRNGVPFRVVRPGEVAELDLGREFDVLLVPSANPEILRDGKVSSDDSYWISDMAPEFRRGLGDDGIKRLAVFVEGGGVVVAWGESVSLLLDPLPVGAEGKDEVRLPARDVGEAARERGLSVTGSWLAVEHLVGHPLTWGLPARGGVFADDDAPVLQTSIPTLGMDRRVVVRFPARDLLLSGFLEGEEQLAGKPAGVWTAWGKGQVVLYAFHPQFRSSTPATYKLVFNAILLPARADMPEVE